MKTMKLYDQVERINNELRELGLGQSAALKVSDLTAFDQYHYFGTGAVDEAARLLGIGPQSRVLDVGSGIGGPARHLASTTGCEVVALELQPDLHSTATDLTRRCALEDHVQHVCGDILGPLPSIGTFHCIVSFLCFLHIADHERLFSVCRHLLRESGQIFVEDFVQRQEPTSRQRDDLRLKLACPSLPDASTYEDQLRRAGFVLSHVEDLTRSWRDFTAERLSLFRAARARQIEVHGVDIVNGLDDFYATVAGLFADGVVGGLRIHARVP
jgi:cyclopropane fatty-acyl-phospholipid synthase-like methyltransferase